jgi:RHS repeat-associated protein
LTGATFGFGSTGTSSDFQLSGIVYDKAGNLKNLQRRDQSGTLIDNLTYSYYNGSDKISEVVDGAAQTPGLDWDAESATYQYDANGNLTSRSDKLSKISYDWRNLPIDFDLNSGQEIVDNYNAGGQRILKELKGGTWTFYVKDGNKTLAVIDQDGLNHFNLFGNKLFGRYEPGNSAHRYYLKDNLGSTRMVTDNNGSILQTFDYYPFGLVMPGRSGGSGSTMEKFTGKEIDDEPVGSGLNLDYFGARFYDAAVGRWSGSDPLSGKQSV